MNRLPPKEQVFFNTISNKDNYRYLPVKMQMWKEYIYSESKVEMRSSNHKTKDFLTFLATKPMFSPVILINFLGK